MTAFVVYRYTNIFRQWALSFLFSGTPRRVDPENEGRAAKTPADGAVAVASIEDLAELEPHGAAEATAAERFPHGCSASLRAG